MKQKHEMKILVAENDLNLSTFLKAYIENYGFNVVLTTNGDEAMKIFQNELFTACIIDQMLPARNGLSLIKDMRKSNTLIPLVFTSIKSSIEDKMKGYQSGCDYYISKPYEVEELILVLISLLKRINKGILENAYDKNIVFGKYKFDYYKRTITCDDNSLLKLTCKENEIFYLLLSQKNQLIHRGKFLNEIWQENTFFNSRSLDVFISNLRKKIVVLSGIKLVNVHGFGFKLAVEDSKS